VRSRSILWGRSRREFSLQNVKMPRTKRPTLRRKSRAKRNMRFRRRPAKRAVINRSLVVLGNGFPQKLVCTHRYRDQITLTSTSGVMATYQFSCNGLYDPNITGGGHQPLYFDQLTPLYNHYQVVGAKMKLRILPHTSNTVTSNFACFVNDDTVFENTNIDGTAEQNGAKCTPFGIPSGGNKPLTRTLYWSSKRKFGTAHLQNSRLQGSSSSNPTEQSFFSLCLQAFDQTNSVQAQILIEIDYIAVWSEIKDVDQS